MSRKRLNEVFDYLSTPDTGSLESGHDTGAIVFGRNDPIVARALVDSMFVYDSLNWAVITGGRGKDSGDLNIPEAEYLAREAEGYAKERGRGIKPIYIETQATNGGENVRNSFAVIRRAQLGGRSIVAIAHATSLRRLGAMIEHEASKHDDSAIDVECVSRIPSSYSFDSTNPADRSEAIAEMERLISWPEKGWLLPQDIPANLVDFIQSHRFN